MTELIVALGPGAPELVPAAAFEALRGSPACVLDGQAQHLAPALERAGVRLAPDAATRAALDVHALALARASPEARTVPARDLLRRQAAAAAAADLVALTELLREQCPWDRAQTAPSIVPHTLEEAYEVADAVATAGLSPKLIDELGDLLFQTTFLARLCDEAGVGDWGDVAAGVARKLRLRHPWVFGDEQAQTPGDARARWEDVKRDSENREGIFHDVPDALPSLLYARKVQRRAAAVGFDYPELAGAVGDLERELAELLEELDAHGTPAAEHEPHPAVAHELGDLLFAAVNVARRAAVDPELALRAASQRFRARVEHAERLARGDAVDFAGAGLEVQERYYQAAKRLS